MNILLLVREADSLADWFFFLFFFFFRLFNCPIENSSSHGRFIARQDEFHVATEKATRSQPADTARQHLQHQCVRVELAGGDQVLVLLHRRSLKTHIHRPFAELASAPSLNNDSCRETLPALYGCIPYPFFPPGIDF